MRDVVVEDRTWAAEDAASENGSERLQSEDPVAAAKVDYGYARI